MCISYINALNKGLRWNLADFPSNTHIIATFYHDSHRVSFTDVLVSVIFARAKLRCKLDIFFYFRVTKFISHDF